MWTLGFFKPVGNNEMISKLSFNISWMLAPLVRYLSNYCTTKGDGRISCCAGTEGSLKLKFILSTFCTCSLILYRVIYTSLSFNKCTRIIGGAVISQSVYCLSYGLDCRSSIPDRAGTISLHRRVQTGCGAYPAFYPTGMGALTTRSKAAGA